MAETEKEHIFTKETFLKKQDYELYKYIVEIITRPSGKKIKFLNMDDPDNTKDTKELFTSPFTRNLNAIFNTDHPNLRFGIKKQTEYNLIDMVEIMKDTENPNIYKGRSIGHISFWHPTDETQVPNNLAKLAHYKTQVLDKTIEIAIGFNAIIQFSLEDSTKTHFLIECITNETNKVVNRIVVEIKIANLMMLVRYL